MKRIMTNTEKLDEIHTHVGVMKEQIKNINKEIMGNGKEGLIKETYKNTEFRIGHMAEIKLIKWACGSAVLMNIIAIALKILKII